MKKKGFKLLFILTLVASLITACGGAGGGSGSAKGDTIKIGLNLELTGGVASYGTSIADGVELAVEEINNNGGINGKQIQLVKIDNKSEAADATSAALKLMTQDKVPVIIGSATSTLTLGQVDLANQHKVVVLTPSGTNEAITVNNGKVNEYMFRTCFIDPFQGTVAANFAFDDLDIKTAAILIDNNGDYAKGLASSFKKVFEEKGGKIVAEEAYLAGDTDFRATLTRIKGTNPGLIYVPGYYEEVGLIIKQGRELGIDVPFMGGEGWDSPILVELAGASALNNTYITNNYSSDDPDPTIQKFVEAFKGKYKGKSPDAFNALGYDSVYLAADAIKRAGGVDDPVKLKEAFEQTKDLSLVTGNTTMDGNHNPIKAATILEFVDGKQTFKTKVNP